MTLLARKASVDVDTVPSLTDFCPIMLCVHSSRIKMNTKIILETRIFQIGKKFTGLRPLKDKKYATAEAREPRITYSAKELEFTSRLILIHLARNSIS